MSEQYYYSEGAIRALILTNIKSRNPATKVDIMDIRIEGVDRLRGSISVTVEPRHRQEEK